MDVVRATTATRVNSAGLIESVGVNIPRIDYTNGSCPSLLVEPQRTNLITYSEQIDNAAWTKVRASITANTTISPDGTQNADTFASSAGQTIFPALTRSPTFLGNTSYSLSIFAKVLGNTNIFKLSYVDNVTGFAGGGASFNLDTQAITIIQSANSSVTANIQNYGNGWYRLSIKFLTIAVPSFNYLEFSLPTFNVGNDFALYGGQLEAASYPTSYIPTVASTVTRNADVISKTGISSLIGQTEGTLFCEIKNIADDNIEKHITISDGTNSNIVDLFYGFYGAGSIYVEVKVANVVQGGLLVGALTVTNMNKIAVVYKTNRFELWVNGIKKSQDLIGTTFSGTTLSKVETAKNGSNAFFGNINSIQLYKTALTDTELQSLTTL
jgi:hypothetical protein